LQRERKHIRLSNWDYSNEGVYFITICCGDRLSYFGKIIKNKMILSEIGSIASQFWMEIPYHFSHVRLDEFIVMPNHVHGILILDNSLARPRHGVALQYPPDDEVGSCHGMTLQDGKFNLQINQNPPNRNDSLNEGSEKAKYVKHFTNQFSKPAKGSVSIIINQYKSSVTRWCKKHNFNQFHWQSRFYDQILHNEPAIDSIREYIYKNPRYWQDDEFYNL